MLLIQFHTDAINTSSDSLLKAYFNKIYQNPVYMRPEAFWELPQWAGELSYVLKHNNCAKPQFKVLKKPQKLNDKVIFGSVLDANSSLWIDTIKLNPTAIFHLGGYVNKNTFIKFNNVIFYSSIKHYCNTIIGNKYKYGVDWSLFKGTKTIPRLTLSDGCRNHCSFCTISSKIKEKTEQEILQQVYAMKDLVFKCVYINDKTFGQAKNHTILKWLGKHIKCFNPDFQGFIIQTTASMLPLLPLRQLCLYAVEIGVESFNDKILTKYHKPSREKHIERAEQLINKAGVYYIPNILIGFPEETKQTYLRTINYLNKATLLHMNIYNYVNYKKANNEDVSENSIERSYNTKEQNNCNLWAIKQILKNYL